MSSSRPLRGWATLVAVLVFVMIPTAMAASRHRSTWGQILIGGGNCENTSSTARAELYDPTTNDFMSAKMKSRRSGAAATLIITGRDAGKILIGGGDGYYPELASTELYDPWSNQIEPGPSMNVPRSNHTATTIVAGGSSGRILFAGGYSTSDSHPLATTELFDPLANKSMPGPTMQTARESHSATLLNAGPHAGKILIAGGTNLEHGDHDGVLASTELYDPERNAFAPGPSMNWARRDHTATVIESGPSAGTILLSGGTFFGLIIVPNDLYDPATNTFAPEGYVPERRGGCFGTFAIQLPPPPPHHSHR